MRKLNIRTLCLLIPGLCTRELPFAPTSTKTLSFVQIERSLAYIKLLSTEYDLTQGRHRSLFLYFSIITCFFCFYGYLFIRFCEAEVKFWLERMKL